MANSSNATEFHIDDFQKEQVLRRLRKKVVEIWGLPETEIDHLDPIVDLLLGACAVEFNRTAQEINTSHSRVLERLAQLMVPEVFTNAKPAHGILHAQADIPKSLFRVEDQLVLEKETQEGSKIIKNSYVFSPVTHTRLVDLSLVCQASGGKLIMYDNPLNKGDIVQGDDKSELQPFTLWIGLKLNDRVENLEGLNLFFDWKNDPDKTRYLPLMHSLEVYLNEEKLNIKPGLENLFAENILSEFDAMSEIEHHVLHLYHHHFITIESKTEIGPKALYPSSFPRIFSEEKLKNLKEELVWLKIRVPEGIPPQALSDLYCAVNCVPIINRTLHTSNRPFSLSSKLNSIPLETEDHFLTVRRVYSSEREFRPVSLKKIRDVEDGSYALRQGGLTRFDQRDAGSMLNNLYDMMRDESAAFSSFGNFTLNSEIKSMEQILSRLQMHLAQKITNQSSRSHLLIYSKNQEDVYVEFWSCHGEGANRIPTGKRPELLTHPDVRSETVLLMNTTSGGKEPMNEVEKLYAYKYTLMTRSRIVTEEDIKSVCFAELGERLEKVEIRKGVMKDLTVKKGFVRTIDIILTPKFQNETNWSHDCRELQAVLERKKMFLTAIRVFIDSETEVYGA